MAPMSRTRRKSSAPANGRVKSWAWKGLGGLSALLVVAGVALAMTFTSGTLSLPDVDVGELPQASPPSDMSISALPTGTYDTPAALAYRGGSWNDTRHFTSTPVLIHHPKGNLLIDAGFGRHVEQHLRLLPSIQRSPHHLLTPAADQLAAGSPHAHGIAAVIPTHFHWDHISGVGDFQGVAVMTTRSGEDWIRSNAEGTEVINSFSGLDFHRYAYEDKPYLGFPRSHDVWGDGSVVIVPSPGHTPDSVVVFVCLPSGTRYAFLGDLVWQLEGLDIPAEKPWMLRWLIGEDADDIQTNIARVRTAVARFPQIRPMPAHDGRAFQQLPQFPNKAH
jgi:glyoxylase-like metal-dependent hydrolase (beta-lactamase superfamily II)